MSIDVWNLSGPLSIPESQWKPFEDGKSTFKNNRRWASRRGSDSSDIGILERLPYELLMFEILPFFTPKDIFSNLQLVNVQFYNLIWKSLNNSRIFNYELVVRKENMEKLKRGHITYFHKKNQRGLDFDCPLRLFMRLCECGAVNLKENGLVIFDYFLAIRLRERRSISEQNRFNRLIIESMQVIVNCRKGAIEDSGVKLEDSFFKKAWNKEDFLMVEFFFSNKESFRIPNVREITKYITPYDRDFKERLIPVVFKNYPYRLQISQDLFEKYVVMKHVGSCMCCDSSYHRCDTLKEFIDLRNRNGISTNPILFKSIVDSILPDNPGRGFYSHGKKLELILLYIDSFGLFKENEEEGEEEEEEEEEVQSFQSSPIRMEEEEMKEYIEDIKKIKKNSDFEDIQRRNYQRENELDLYQRRNDNFDNTEEKLTEFSFVTGGAGFLGSHLCHRLLDMGNEVIAVDNLYVSMMETIEELERKYPTRFSFIKHDVIDPLIDIAIFSNPKKSRIDLIFNFACPGSPKQYQIDPVHTLKTNFLGAINTLELAKLHDAKILQASTSEVYGDPEVHPQSEGYLGNVNPIGPRSCYDEGKRAAETLFMEYRKLHNVRTKLIRIFNTYGPNMHPQDGRVVSNFIMQALRGEQLTMYGTGQQTRSFCYVDDLIEGILRMMSTEDSYMGPVNLGNDDEKSLLELSQVIFEVMGQDSKLSFLPLPIDDPKRRRPNIKLARTKLGWEPKVSLREGVRRTVNYFKKIIENPPKSLGEYENRGVIGGGYNSGSGSSYLVISFFLMGGVVAVVLFLFFRKRYKTS